MKHNRIQCLVKYSYPTIPRHHSRCTGAVNEIAWRRRNRTTATAGAIQMNPDSRSKTQNKHADISDNPHETLPKCKAPVLAAALSRTGFFYEGGLSKDKLTSQTSLSH